MSALIDSYEQLLEESVSTIAALRFSLQRAEMQVKNLQLHVFQLSPRALEINAFDDTMEWTDADFNDEVYLCPQCGAPGNPNGSCGMPCI